MRDLNYLSGDRMLSRRTFLAGSISLAALGAPLSRVAAESSASDGQRYSVKSDCAGVFATPDGFESRIFKEFNYELFSDGSSRLLNDLSKYLPIGASISAEESNQDKAGRYYVSNEGSSWNSGRSWGSALSSVSDALSKPDVDVVYVKSGVYFHGFNLGEYKRNRDVSIQGVDGPVYFITVPKTDFLKFSKTSDNTVYVCAFKDKKVRGFVSLDHLDSAGNPFAFERAESLDELKDRTGLWFSDGNKGFISWPDSKSEPSRVLPYHSRNMGVYSKSVKFHHSGITYIGGKGGAFTARDGDLDTVVYAERINTCGSTRDGYQVLDIGVSISVKCSSSRNVNDGFNYHEHNGISPHFLEINCVGAENLKARTGNGSTCHEAVHGFRLGGLYFKNRGPGVADINDARTFNARCTSNENGNRDRFGHGFQISGKRNDETPTSHMWLHSCIATGNSGAALSSVNGGVLEYLDTYIGGGVVEVDDRSTSRKYLIAV
ncbi:hypothetical protein GIW50_03250 [Pseudomonas syringae]|uniref:Uncharacterized protein n=1 Tax=Pseudomonas syringae TaxID=317 RepID=A0A9Q3ZWK3_PSESX|nr:hypothetical protein [Pseudomonas syringae]MCF5062036.1 hypothetical protein [Pseudomonas syringae]MCF5075144.1 hypothetical protein [Pseudomonas syringae]MCF5117422.1 hypothetical protein [Pseudomonas syringae]MCF5379582.1 hypothetical protein [Pseudomonas syringae]